MATKTTDDESTDLECVDARDFECPNGHGLLRVKSETEVYCPECNYTRTVFGEVNETVNNYDGADITRESIQGVFEYTVTLSEDDVADLRDTMSARDLAENIAQSRFSKEVDPTFSVESSDVRAYELDEFDKMSDAYKEFEVTVKFSQNE